jgi:PEP-CTERM motif
MEMEWGGGDCDDIDFFFFFLLQFSTAGASLYPFLPTPMKKTVLVLALTASLATLTGSMEASSAIIYDTFSYSDGTSLNGLTPSVSNLPGGSWNASNNGWSTDRVLNGAMYLDTDNWASISLQSSGSYSKPNVLYVSADLNLGSLVNNDNEPQRGITLGFNSSVLTGGSSSSGANRMWGLTLAPNGDLKLTESGGTVASVAYVGTWQESAYHTLQFQLDASTYTISNVFLSGSTANYSPLQQSNFTMTPNYVSVRVSDSDGNHAGQIDNLIVSGSPIAVPEPSTYALFGLGAIGMLMVMRRKMTA